MNHVVKVGDGRVVVPHATYERYLGGAVSAVLLQREGEVYLMPLAGPVAGGALLKQRNLDGDRVLLATDFLSECGLGRFTPEREYAVRWVDASGALLIEGLRSGGAA